MLRRHWILTLVSLIAIGCAGSYDDDDPDFTEWSEDDFGAAVDEQAVGDYLRLVTVRDQTSTTYLMHWPERKMPLAVYLPPPPAGLFENPDAVEDAVRRGVLDWKDVVENGVPSFEFVDDPGDADIPFVWADAPDGDWYIAFCSYDVRIPTRFGVSHILVTGRWGDGDVASLTDIYATTLHEMGHALGLMGHSESPADIMYPSVRGQDQVGLDVGLSKEDRKTLKMLYEHGTRRFTGRRGARN